MSTTVEHYASTMSTTIETNLQKTAMAAARSVVNKSGKGLSAIEGNIYHVDLAVMIILRAYGMRPLDNELDFLVAVEVSAAGKFDDILYHYSSPQQATTTLFIQAKCKQNKESMLEQDTLCPPQEDSKGNYSIPMYFVSFLEVDEKLTDDARYVLCTNVGLHEKISCHFKEIKPQLKTNQQKDNFLQFCEDIAATCYQFDCNKPFPGLVDKLKDACLAKLGKELAQAVFKDQVMTFNNTLFKTFFNLINKCIEPLELETSDPSVSIYKLAENFFIEHESTTIGKLRSYFEKEREILLKKVKKMNNNKTTNQLKIKIHRDSFEAASKTAPTGDFSMFDQKVSKFYEKFLLLCNSCNEEKLKTQAMDLLPQWCGADGKTIIDMLEGKLLNAMKSTQPVPMDRRYMQDFFLKIDVKQNISDLKCSSRQYFELVDKKHPNIKMLPIWLKGSKLYTFLKHESCGGCFEFKNTLDLTVSSRILLQMLSLLQYETLFVDSTKYAKQKDINDILEELLSYLRDINHPFIKVITILGKHDHVSIHEIKKLSEKYCRKIVIVEKISGSRRNEEAVERIKVNLLSDEALTHFYKHNERMLFGTYTPLSSIVKEFDDLSLLLDVLDLCDQPGELIHSNLNEQNYEKIKQLYVGRHFVSPNQVETRNIFDELDDPFDVQSALASNDEELDTPGFLDNGKVCIILNDAGLGKTTYFTWLAWRLSTLNPSLYVIKFNAMEYSTDFKRLLGINVQNLDDTEMVRLLYRFIHLALFVTSINNRKIDESDLVRNQADRCAKLLQFSNGSIILDDTEKIELTLMEIIEMRLFQEKFNQRKLVLILDGFDEIAPFYKDVVMHCFARFARFDGVQSVYLSSRPYGFEQELKTSFDQCGILQLKPFSKNDIILSCHKFLLINLDGYKHYEENHRNYILETLNKILCYVMKDLTTVPLLLYMVQIILLPKFKNHVNEKSHILSYEMYNTNLDILHLVESFIDKKIEILSTDKTGTSDSAGSTAAVKINLKRMKKEIKEQHMLLAMCVLFDSAGREKLLSRKEQKRAEELMEEVNDGDEKTGIVLGVQNGVPQFLHRIFAEYFTACWLYENLERFKNESIFRSQTIWSDSLGETREFLDRLILRESKGCELHLALVNKSIAKIKEILHFNPSAVAVPDKVGRLPLHLLHYHLDAGIHKGTLFLKTKEFKQILTCPRNEDRELFNKKDMLYGWNALDYAFVLNAWSLIKTLFTTRVQLNMDILSQQVCSNDIKALLIQETKYVNYIGRKDLADELSKHVAKYLIADKQIDIYSPLAELNHSSVIGEVIDANNVSMFGQLSTTPHSMALDSDDHARRLFELLTFKRATDGIQMYLLDKHPTLVSMIHDNQSLFVYAKCAIKNNQTKLFKIIFKLFCSKNNIPCVEEDNIIDEFADQNDAGLEIPFGYNCCNFYYEALEFNIERLLSEAIHKGNIQMVSYIIQKTNMVDMAEVFETTVHKIRGNDHENKNYKYVILAFKYLFKKIVRKDREEGVDQVFLDSFLTIIEYGCVYMLHSLFAVGFDLDQINALKHWDVFHHRLVNSDERHSANIFVYLQQRSFVNFFHTFGPTGESIFEVAINSQHFTVAQALFQDEFRNLSISEKENFVLDLLLEQLLKHGMEQMIDMTKSFLTNSERGEMENETWYSVYYSFCQQNVDKLHLVERLIHRKIEHISIHMTEPTNSLGTSDALKENDRIMKKKINKEQHMLLAMYVLFDSAGREKLLSRKEQKRAEELMEEVNDGDEKTGIVLGVQNGVPQFLHRIFAEYFTACWLYENWERMEKDNIFRSETIWSDSLKETRELLDRLILRESEGCDLHLALVNKSIAQIEGILRFNPSACAVKDKIGRLPFCLFHYILEVREDKSIGDKLLEVIEIFERVQRDEFFHKRLGKVNRRNAQHKCLCDFFTSGITMYLDILCQQVCTNTIDALLKQEEVYNYIFVEHFDKKDLADELSEKVAKCLSENKQIDVPYSTLLEKVSVLGSVTLKNQLILKLNSR